MSLTRRDKLNREIMDLWPTYRLYFAGEDIKALLRHHYGVHEVRKMTVEQVAHFLGFIKQRLEVTHAQ